MSIGTQELLVIVVAMVVVLSPFWKIFSKAGFPGPLSVMMLIPGLNVIGLYYLAFAEWPSLNNTKPSDRVAG